MPSSTLKVRGQEVELSDPIVTFGARTVFYDYVSVACSLGFMWTVMAFMIDLPPWIMSLTITLGLSAGLALFWLKTEYVIDNDKESVDYLITLGDYRWQRKVAPFDNLPIVTVMGFQRQSRYAVWWIYAVALVDKKGNIIQFTDFERADDGFANACQNASTLATHFRSHYVEGQKERILETSFDKSTGRLKVSHVRQSILHGLPETVKTILAYCALKLFLSVVFTCQSSGTSLHRKR